MKLYFFHERILNFHDLTNSLTTLKYIFTLLFYILEKLELHR